MSQKPMHGMLLAATAAALALAISPAASAAQTNVVVADSAPIVLAQAPMSAPATRVIVFDPALGAVNYRGVREAALQGPDELRRYIFRTRSIYNYYYEDWATRP